MDEVVLDVVEAVHVFNGKALKVVRVLLAHVVSL